MHRVHRADLSGGPVPGGDPSWPPARNITPHTGGLAAWSYDDFTRAMREARGPTAQTSRSPWQ